jgi:two-component system KDP operon response regulator KdpE
MTSPERHVPEVLLVEDEAPIALVIGRALTARGYAVREARTGSDAVKAAAERSPDVLILDISLPDITGWEVLRQLGEGFRQSTPVVVYSAAPLAENRVEEFQPAGVLQKPFPIDAITRLVAELTAARKESHA